MRCNKITEVFSRVVGFYRPVSNWNPGKKEEFKNRAEYIIKGGDKSGLQEEKNKREKVIE